LNKISLLATILQISLTAHGQLRKTKIPSVAGII